MSSTTQASSTGVRVDPTYLRDPSTLQSISSALFGFSSYVASSIPGALDTLRKVAGNSADPVVAYQNSLIKHHPEPPFTDLDTLAVADYTEVKNDTILFAAFDEIEVASSGGSTTHSVLSLGYPDGFQIWNVTNAHGVQEVVSYRDNVQFCDVKCIKVLPHPRSTSNEIDKYEQDRPLVAVVCPASPSPDGAKNIVKIVSLKKHDVIGTLNEPDPVAVKCNERVIVVSYINPARLVLYSSRTLAQMHKLTDVAFHPETRVPVFALSPRLLAYATTTHPTDNSGKGDRGMSLGEEDDVAGVAKYQEVAKGMAKEMAHGVKKLGDYGYQAISAFMSSNANAALPPKQVPSMPISINNRGNSNRSTPPGGSLSPQRSFSSQRSFSPQSPQFKNGSCGTCGGNSPGSSVSVSFPINGYNKVEKDDCAIGTIIVCDTGTPRWFPVVAHFQRHAHPISHISFNPSGVLLFSTSTKGHKFDVHEFLGKRPRGGSNRSMKHVYKLTRGLTYASVGEGAVNWSGDSRWCGVASGRGTIHVYATNPYGGPTHVPSHLKGEVLNMEEPYPSTQLATVVRIKPRTPLPPDPTEAVSNGLMYSHQAQPSDFDTYGQLELSMPPAHRPSPLNGSPSSIHNGHGSYPHGNTQLIHSSQHAPAIYPPLLFKPPGLCLKFLPSLAGGATPGFERPEVGRGGSKRSTKRRSSPSESNAALDGSAGSVGQQVRRRTKSWAQSDGSSATRSRYLDVSNGNEKRENVAHQDILSFHPAGILTLHRIWLEGVEVDTEQNDAEKEDSGAPLALAPLGSSVTTVANVGRALADGAAGVVNMGMSLAGARNATAKVPGEPSLELAVTCEDVAEWKLSRSPEWNEFKPSIEAPKRSKGRHLSSKKGSSKFLAHAEIATHTTSRTSLPPPLWLTPQFTFWTYGVGATQTIQKAEVPVAKKVEIRREMVERVDFAGINGASEPDDREMTSEDGGVVARNVEDISANISHAMGSFLQSSPSISATVGKSLGGSPRIGHAAFGSDLDSITSLSFEDAYHVRVIPAITTSASSSGMASESSGSSAAEMTAHSPWTGTHLTASPQQRPHPLSRSSSSSSIFSGNNDVLDDTINFFSPDGDNEVDYPAESVLDLNEINVGNSDENVCV